MVQSLYRLINSWVFHMPTHVQCDLGMSIRVVHLSPEADATSETFIRAHRDQLPFDILSIYRWRPPYRTRAGHWIALLPGGLSLFFDRVGLKALSGISRHWANRSVAGWLHRIKADVVLAEYGPLGANIAPACELARVPLVVIFHGFDAFQHVTLKSYERAYRKLFSTAAALVVVSEPMRHQLIKLGAPVNRIHVNSCGVDPTCFSAANPSVASPVFLAIGRFVGKKGPLHTIEAFARVHQHVPDSRLWMIGTGPLLSDCRQRASQLGLSERITFFGACSHDAVRHHLRQVRAVVQHSLRCGSGDQEGTPVALIEAQMAGVPVVSTRHAGIPAVVMDGSTGFLVDEGDVKAMAEAMIRLATDPQLAAEMGAAGRLHALKHHTLERHIAALATTIRGVIHEAPLVAS